MKLKEFIVFFLVVVVMTLVLSFKDGFIFQETLLNSFLISLIILFVSVFSKKYVANILDSRIEINFWQWRRYWITRHAYFIKPIPVGLLFPLVLSIFSEGVIIMLAFLQFSAFALPSKVAKKYGTRRFSSVIDWEYALICFYSMLAVLLLGIVSSFISSPSFPFEYLGHLCFYYSVWNILPIGQLDGIRIFFGSRPLYVFALILLALSGFIIFI